MVSHPVRGAWIEIKIFRRAANGASKSHPVRGAWIEIAMENLIGTILSIVAPRQGCVD